MKPEIKTNKDNGSTTLKITPEPNLLKPDFKKMVILLSLLNFDNNIILTHQLTKPAGTFILPLKGLNPGIYLIHLEQDGKSLETQKLVVIQ